MVDQVNVNIDTGAASVIGQKIAEAISTWLGKKATELKAGGTDVPGIAAAAIPAATALGGVKDQSNAATASLTKFAGVIPFVGNEMAGLITDIETARQQTNKNFQQGIGGLSMFDTAERAAKAGFNSQEQYRQELLKSNNALGGINSSANTASNDLLRLGQEVRKADVAKGTNSILNSGAMLGDELARVAVLSQYGRRDKLSEGEATNRAVDATDKLSREIIRQAGVTGKSTTAIEAELEERLQQPAVLANLRQMTERQRESFIQNQVALTGMGTTVQGLSATLGVNGRMTQDQQYALAAMGPAAGEFQRASRMAAMAQTEDQKKQAEVAMLKAKADINAYQNSAQFARVMSSAQGPIKDAYENAYKQNQLAARQAAGQRDTGESGATVLKRAGENVDLTVAGKKRDEKTGQVVPDQGQTLNRMATEGVLRAQTNTQGMIGAMNDLGKTMDRNGVFAKKYGDALDFLYGKEKDVEAAQARNAKFIQDVANAVRGTNGGTNNGNGGNTNPNVPPVNPGQRIPRQAEGSKSTFGDWFSKDWGDGGLSELHGKEAVVPQAKIGEFMKDMMSSMTKPKTQEAQTEMPSIPSPETPATGTGSGDNVTLKDVLASLNQLNKTMGQVASHSESISDASNKTARLSSKATGNRMAV
jgi:hypothetical protein